MQVINDCDPPSARVNASFVPYMTQVGYPGCKAAAAAAAATNQTAEAAAEAWHTGSSCDDSSSSV
jgi:hypothetical protein